MDSRETDGSRGIQRMEKDGLIPRGLKSRSEYKRVSMQKLGRFPTQVEWEEYCEAAEKREGPPKE